MVAVIDPTTDRGHLLRRNAPFRRYLSGEFVTNLGDSLYAVAVVWFALQVSGSAFVVSVVNAALLTPWLLQFAAGAVVDRVDVIRLLVVVQPLQGVGVAGLAVAGAAGWLTVPSLIAVVAVLALLAVTLTPVQARLVPRLVADDRLSTGNSLLATVTLGLDTVFEAVGGLLIPVFGVAPLLAADAATFLVAAVLFARVCPGLTDDADGAVTDETGDVGTDTTETGDAVTDTTTTDDTDQTPTDTTATDDNRQTLSGAITTYLADTREGVAALRGTVFVELVAVSAVFHLALGATLAVLPVYAATRGGAGTYGLLLGAFGVGRVVGTSVADRLAGLPYGLFRAGTSLAAAGVWLASVAAGSRVAAVALFGLAWVPAGANGVLVSTLNQRLFPSELLGRVSSLKGTASTATLPVGSLLGGAAATLLGARTAMALGATGFAVAGVWFLLRARLRRLPSVDDATPAAFDVTVDAGDDSE